MCLAIPGEVLSISGDEKTALTGRVNFSGTIKKISMAYVPEAQVGDYVIVHAGFAISLLDTEQAQAALVEVDAFLRMQQEMH